MHCDRPTVVLHCGLESTEPSSAVTLCAAVPAWFHTTVPPDATVTSAGSYELSTIATSADGCAVCEVDGDGLDTVTVGDGEDRFACGVEPPPHAVMTNAAAASVAARPPRVLMTTTERAMCFPMSRRSRLRR